MHRFRALLVGAGGFGSVWVDRFLPAVADRVSVAGIVDNRPEPLTRAAAALNLPSDRTFADMDEAFAQIEADFAILVVQPHLRTRAVQLAFDRGMAVLCEKPIAESWESSLEILNLARSTGSRIAVIQNYPATNRIRTLKSVLDSGSVGRINYLHARFAADYTIHSAGGSFRHQVPYAMLFEGAVHHFDQLRNLSGGDGARIRGAQWNPSWSTFENPSTGLFLIEMTNGVNCLFELNHLAKGEQNGWHHEYYRVEGELGTAIVDNDDAVRVIEHVGSGRIRTTEIEPIALQPEGHEALIKEFLTWLEGGDPAPTRIDDNIYSAAIAFGAVEAVRSGTTIDISAMLAGAGLPPESPRRRSLIAAAD